MRQVGTSVFNSMLFDAGYAHYDFLSSRGLSNPTHRRKYDKNIQILHPPLSVDQGVVTFQLVQCRRPTSEDHPSPGITTVSRYY